ncbi:MAG: hypothetical protein ACRYF0_07690 [Janthinobacterium lividum]
MRLPELDQQIHLQWGEAAQLAHAIEWVLTGQLTLAAPARVPASLMLCLGPLTRVGTRLLARARQEKQRVGAAPTKPRKMVLRYDEVAGLMKILPVAPAAGLAWAEVQQVSLTLERYIDFTR